MLQIVAESLDGQPHTITEAQTVLKEKEALPVGGQVQGSGATPDFAEMLTILANLYDYLLKLN